MAQPQWITAAGSLGTIAEGVFYSVSVTAVDPDEGNVQYRVIAGQLPDGVSIRDFGRIEGVPKPVSSVQGVPAEVSRDVTSRFAVRAYTTKVVNGVIVVDRISDRTFSLTVTGQDIPDFVTPPGQIAQFYDGTEARVQIQFTDNDPDESIIVRVVNGELPPDMVITRTGLISGIITPISALPDTAVPGYSSTTYDQYPFDFPADLLSKTFQFTIEITDGKDSNLRTFSIFVVAKSTLTADNDIITADNTFITADVTPLHPPIILNYDPNLGTVRSDNFYAHKFEGIDFDDAEFTYSVVDGALPSGLVLNSSTGWLYGYLPDQGNTQDTYEFTLQLNKVLPPNAPSDLYPFVLTVTGDVGTEVTWLTNPNLGTINNGATSTLEVVAVNSGGRSLQYRIVSGSDSKLPQGLTLRPSGHIVGRVSFNTFALDGGTTVFDVNLNPRLGILETTFDMTYTFTVNAYAPVTDTLKYNIKSITIISGGINFTSTPTVTISAPPATLGSRQATAGAVTIVSGNITAIAVNDPGSGYVETPTILITGGGGSGATAIAQLELESTSNPVSVFRTFTITVIREFDVPYGKLYIKAMPPFNDRALIENLLQNQQLFPYEFIYRNDDPNFGIAQNVVYDHAYGLTPASLDAYAQSLDINHYWKNLVLGEIKSAQAVDANGQVLYEVVYSTVIDNLVNNQGESVSKQVTLPYPVNPGDSTEIDIVYPNSLINMRDQVIDQIGQISSALPLWMTSKQADGSVLGFVPAWVIAYINPGRGNEVIYNINENFGVQLNKVDFKADRYELDRSQTHSWEQYDDSTQGHWVPSPPAATTFDIQAHYQLPPDSDSTLPYSGGTGYEIGDQILILGSQLNGEDVVNNLIITVLDVDTAGIIQVASLFGTALFTTLGAQYFDISGTNITGSGVGATWDINVVGLDPTIFDGGATTFITPADTTTNTDVFDKYLLYPRINILG